MRATAPLLAFPVVMRCASVVALLVASTSAGGQAVPRALTAGALPNPSANMVPRSVVFDSGTADDLRVRQQPTYVERILVEGRDPDGPRFKRKSLEQTFAESLLAPPAASAMGLRRITTTPCYAVQSTINILGDSIAPLTGCPGAANTP